MSILNGVVKGAVYQVKAAKLLIVEDPVKNSVKCKCLYCGDVDTYKVSMLTNSEVHVCKNCQGNLKIGKIYGETIKLNEFVVIQGKVGAKLRCEKCDKMFIHDVNIVKSKDYHCPICISNKQVQSVKEDINVSKIKSKQPKLEEKKKKEKEDVLVGNIISAQIDEVRDFSSYKKKGDFIEVGKYSRRSKTGMSVQPMVKAQCVKCGQITQFKESQFNENSKCEKCDKLKDSNKNILNNINWIGYIKNNMEVIGVIKDTDGVLKAKIKCLICESESIIPLVSFIYEKEIVCNNCADAKLNMICPLCKKPHINITPRNLYKIREETTYLACNNKKDKVALTEVAMQHEMQVKLDSIRKRYKGYTLEQRFEGRGEIATILKFKEGYIGTNGEEYNTCMCLEHNKMMVLNDNEIMQYKHEYCADTRMIPYNPKKRPK